MKQRGRPRHPDVLTPRQWEVLALLRQGLSNDQIALRLGISLDGVKFHVSEILGKLGVTSRNEAARWHEDRERIAPSASLRHGRAERVWAGRNDSPRRRGERGGRTQQARVADHSLRRSRRVLTRKLRPNRTVCRSRISLRSAT